MDLIRAYEDLCQKNHWVPDGDQKYTLRRIEEIFGDFKNQPKWYEFWRSSPKSPLGIYLWGDVGRGKTFLMDLFFEHTNTLKKSRWHYTEFMQMVHQMLAQFAKGQSEQPIIAVAKDLSQRTRVICLDEFQVTEIGDAMVLSRLFQKLIDEGVFVIVTSNKSPQQLYQEGLHYDRFEPFVQLISKEWETIYLKSDLDTDFRRRISSREAQLKTIYELQCQFQEIVRKEGHQNGDFMVYKRVITFPNATPTALWVTFDELCDQNYGAAEYHAIAKHYKTVFLVRIPRMGGNNRDQARRFIILIDCLYDNNVQFYYQSDFPPDQLYREKGKNTLPFERTASRLVEMSAKFRLNSFLL